MEFKFNFRSYPSFTDMLPLDHINLETPQNQISQVLLKTTWTNENSEIVLWGPQEYQQLWFRTSVALWSRLNHKIPLWCRPYLWCWGKDNCTVLVHSVEKLLQNYIYIDIYLYVTIYFNLSAIWRKSFPRWFPVTLTAVTLFIHAWIKSLKAAAKISADTNRANHITQILVSLQMLPL